MSSAGTPTGAVVAYVHPADDPVLWEALPRAAAALHFLVVNVHDGPGQGRDPDYEAVLPPLLRAGAPVVGYVDTGYGAVPVRVSLEQAARWRSQYGVGAVFLDQVVSSATDHLRALCRGLRAAGVERIVLNPGTVTAPEVMDLADVVCTYEGPWSGYRHTPPRPGEHGDERVAHLVHGVADADVGGVLEAARSHGPAALAVGASRGTSTWGRVPWPPLGSGAAARPACRPA